LLQKPIVYQGTWSATLPNYGMAAQLPFDSPALDRYMGASDSVKLFLEINSIDAITLARTPWIQRWAVTVQKTMLQYTLTALTSVPQGYTQAQADALFLRKNSNLNPNDSLEWVADGFRIVLDSDQKQKWIR
jgi:hypothetical protein